MLCQILGDWAFERGGKVEKVTTRSTGDVNVTHGKHINIYQRQTDGSWKIARRIRNFN
jgi:ketosteroid isomerase-like protein